MTQPSAAESYDWWAEAYDECNAENDYELWLGEILLPQLEKHGLNHGWALDIGCGTGLSFAPLLKRGWQVVGCDASKGMLVAAESKFGTTVRLLKLDARKLPPISPSPGQPSQQTFGLVLMLNDVINYLTDDGDLGLVLSGIRKNLSPTGLAVLDANTVELFRRDYATGVSEDLGDSGWKWRGLTERSAPNQVYEAELQDPFGLSQIHTQRHWSRNRIESAVKTAGLECRSVLGQCEHSGDIRLSAVPTEGRDQKILYLLSHPRPHM